MTFPMMSAQFASALRLGDTALVLSHRLSEMCGKGPALEEDIALANIALDLLGQARNWLTYAGELEGAGRDEDALAYRRTEREFRNLLLVEQPNLDYAHVLMRQFLFDAWHVPLLQQLSASHDPRSAEIAAKSHKEAAYHLHRSADLVVRLGDGTEESHARMQNALDALWMYTGEMFEQDTFAQGHPEADQAFNTQPLREHWHDTVGDLLRRATLAMPSPAAWMQTGARNGIHTEHLGYLLSEMQVLQRTYPGAKW